MNQNYFAVEVKAGREAVEAVEFALTEAGAEGTELDLLGKKDAEIVSIVGYFPETPDENSVREWLQSGLQIYELPEDAIRNVSIRAVENRDWLAEWKKHWQPTETGRFIVAPSWSEIEKTEKIILRIEPGMAFGTGTHETTRLCLQAIEENFEPEMSFFDVGTGTGVLAIAAAKLKSEIRNQKSEILACDTDEDSVKIAEENAEINNVADNIKFYAGSISSESPECDFVAANLTADVIVPLLALLVEKSRKFLVLSGILREQQDSVTDELEKFKIQNSKLKIQSQGEWISILIKR